ncbi:helix-turn-helix domain-containing protein [Mucilaginibacter sp. 3215]|uniref:helix-turn-helix domain-containing protein n=1 Tax=Mucilaginibacter sp. 3215 TaxID=3373912 RepID=UPI003D220562
MHTTPEERLFLEKVGLKIAQLREQKEWSRQQLADMADIDIAMLIQIEQGACDVDLWDMDKLHKSLGVDSGKFFAVL